MTSKCEQQYSHARRRAWERYDKMIDKGFVKRIVRTIQDNKAQLIRRQSNRVTIWDVDIDNSKYKVVYDNSTKNIATFLPLEDKTDTNLW